MRTAQARILDDFPYPVAYPYSLIFSAEDQPSVRRWALCFTEYQLLRFVCLSLVSQYLREPVDETAAQSISALNTAIAGIRSPFFGDWITLAHTLRRHLTKVGIEPLFPGFAPALEALTQPEERPIGLRGSYRLDPLNAILALRNQTAHGGLPDQAEATEHVDQYLPVLHQVLAAFDFLGDSWLRVRCDQPEELLTGQSLIRTLRGAQPPEAHPETLPSDLEAAFAESAAIVVGPQGKTAPLYPLFKPVPEREPLFLYDGHYGIQVATRQGPAERSYVYYLGTHARITDIPASEHLRELLARRRISFFLEKDKTAPWTIADSALDYSRRTLEDLVGTKYFPQCYLPFEETEREFESFIRLPDQAAWPPDRTRRRYVNGFVLVGLAGAGKTAFLARQSEKLLGRSESEPGRENPNLILFLRGNAVTLRAEGMSLFRDGAERLGIAVAGASSKSKERGGFSSFREMLDHLDGRWKQDRVEGRRLILILDALNEAPYAETVIKEALDMAGEAARYPWCKIVFSIRQEWLGIWSGKMGAQETSPLEELRLFLHSPKQNPDRQGSAQGPPVINLEPFTDPQAAEVYRRYQTAANQSPIYPIPACTTAWSALIVETRGLLTNPLYLHLFMTTFDRRAAEPLANVPVLFERYVDTTMALRDGLRVSTEVIVSHLLEDLGRASADLTDDDCNQVRDAWADTLSSEEARLSLSPVEALAHEGIIRKRVREEGGGYRFVFQTVAEYLIYRYLVAARPQQEDEAAYWLRRANNPNVFAEYAGAFGFLLRDWDSRGALSQVVPLLESSPAWMQETLIAFLLERARVGYVPGQGSSSAERAARSLALDGGERTAMALKEAGSRLSQSRYRLPAAAFFRSASETFEVLYVQHPDNDQIAHGLGSVLNNLGLLLRDLGQVVDSEQRFRRAVQVYEDLHAKTKRDYFVVVAYLAVALTNLGLLLSDAGRAGDAERAYRRAAQISEIAYKRHPENIEIGDALAHAFRSLADLQRSAGHLHEAESAYRRAVEIGEALYSKDPVDLSSRYRLVQVLNNFGLLLRDVGKAGDAESAYRRAVQIGEPLYLEYPENLETGYGLALALNNLGNLLRNSGRPAEAEQLHCRAIEVHEALYEQDPLNVRIGASLSSALNNFGNLLRKSGRLGEAESAYRRAVQIGEVFYSQRPEHLGIGEKLASALSNLGIVLHDGGRADESESVFRRAVQIRESHYTKYSQNVLVCHGFANALSNLALLLSYAGRSDDAKKNYTRAIKISEALYAQNPKNVISGNGLAASLYSLGNLLSEEGRVEEANRTYASAIQIRKALYEQDPDNVEIKVGYASSLCSVGRYPEAQPLVDEVLSVIPSHPFAKKLARTIAEWRAETGGSMA